MPKIKVPINEKPYNVFVEPGLLENIGNELINLGINNNQKILIISNKEIGRLYGEQIINSLNRVNLSSKLFVIEAGEQYKNIDTLSKIYDVAFETGIDRSSLMIALGGGIVGDITGLAAATWLRGVDYIQIPTTLLAMVDSSVGGKTAVNHPNGKNLIGAFHQPKAVFVDTNTLKTLPIREFKAGLAEVIKYGVIRDKGLFEYLEQKSIRELIFRLDHECLTNIITRSVKSKSDIVGLDEQENGIRAILNYGHSFGHVIENICGYGKYLHGEAISIGMRIAGDISSSKGYWKAEESHRQNNLLKEYNLPIDIPKIGKDNILKILMGDKKVRGGKMRFILPKEIGKVDIFDNIKDTDFLNYFD